MVRVACSTPKRLPPPVVELALSVGPNAADAERDRDAEENAEDAAEHARGERLGGDLAHDLALRPTERLERAQLAHPLADGREREQRREQERGDCGDDREGEAEVVREVGGVDERAADGAGDLLRARDLRLVVRCLAIRFSTAATEALSSARTSTTLTRFFWPESFWSCASGR